MFERLTLAAERIDECDVCCRICIRITERGSAAGQLIDTFA